MKSLRLVLFALGAVLVALTIGRWQGHREGRADLEAERVRHEAERLTLQRKHQTDSLFLATRARVAEERAERVARRQLQAQTASSRAALDTARTVLADTAASREQLERALTETTHNLALQVAFSDSYQAAAEKRFAKDSAERVLLASALVTSDSIGGVWKDEAKRIARASQCRIGFVPCPTRTQAFVGGGIVVAVALWKARR